MQIYLQIYKTTQWGHWNGGGQPLIKVYETYERTGSDYPTPMTTVFTTHIYKSSSEFCSKPNRVYGNLRCWYVMTTMIFCCMSLQAGHVISFQACGQNINTGNGWNTSDYINTYADQTTICNGDTRRCYWGTQWPLSCVFSSIIRSTNAKKPSVYTFTHKMFYI